LFVMPRPRLGPSPICAVWFMFELSAEGFITTSDVASNVRAALLLDPVEPR
jgi:hypothetical protein